MNKIQRLGIYVLNNSLNRNLHTTVIREKQFVKREVTMLRKLMHGREKGKKLWFEENISKVPTATSLSNSKGPGKSASRRISVLNKLFMKNITDLMATGEVSDLLLGHGLEISHVKVSPDFLGVNVYWLAKGTDNDDKIEELLHRIALSLRHEMSQLRLMGEVPKIHFVKDKQYAKIVEVDIILDKADFGDDFIPHDTRHLIRSELSGDLSSSEVLVENEEILPEIRHDVFGLNQKDIMDRIKQSMTKTRSAWERYELGAVPSEEENDKAARPTNISSTNQQVKEIVTAEREAEFTKFLERRKTNRKQSAKDVHNLQSVYEYNKQHNIESYEETNQNDEDYLEDEYDSKNKS